MRNLILFIITNVTKTENILIKYLFMSITLFFLELTNLIKTDLHDFIE
jgi:hypothetical protein